MAYAKILYRCSYVLGHQHRSRKTRVRENDRKLLAAISGRYIVRAPERVAKRSGDRPQTFVALLMSIGVIKQLKIVNIDHQQG